MLVKTEADTLCQFLSCLDPNSKACFNKRRRSLALITIWVSPFLVKRRFSCL
uniref:Uncharacterized protein n=1 Tax=Rhizophora mucronata TaxID=61149 RepID=A0A2P2ND72_RHIMU